MTRRHELEDWLVLLEQLKPYCEAGNPLREPFNLAWNVAYERASKAAEAWAQDPD